MTKLLHHMRVLVFGTFDVFHQGHRDFLRQAAACGDELSVIIARDRNVKQIKGVLPIDDEKTRLRNVRKYPAVVNARLGYEDLTNVYDVLNDIKPDVICLGYDQNGFADRLPEEIIRRGYAIPVIRLKAYKPQKFKSSLLRASLR